MSPVTHLLASWIIAARTTDNAQDRRLVTLAGILPDADGLGLIVDISGPAFGLPQTHLYGQYHHYLLHGVFGAVLVLGLLTAFARHPGRVAWLGLLVFHLHLLCDLAGSRGPSPDDLWPIFYLGPFSRTPMWEWTAQWPLNAWQIRAATLLLLAWSGIIAVRGGESVVGVFHRRADRVLVDTLQKWSNQLRALQRN